MAKDSRSTFPIIDENGCPVDPTIFPRYNYFVLFVPVLILICLYCTDQCRLQCSLYQFCLYQYRPRVILWHDLNQCKDTSLVFIRTSPSSVPSMQLTRSVLCNNIRLTAPQNGTTCTNQSSGSALYRPLLVLGVPTNVGTTCINQSTGFVLYRPLPVLGVPTNVGATCINQSTGSVLYRPLPVLLVLILLNPLNLHKRGLLRQFQARRIQ